MDAARIEAIGREPIPGADPVGENARYDSQFELVMEEMGKLESIEQQAVDYYVVEKNSLELLEQKTKDLRLASWLVVALYRSHGFAGLGPGLGLWRALAENFWEPMHPPVKRLRARMTLLQWIADALGGDLENPPAVGPSDREALTLCVTNFSALETLASERFADDPPVLGPARRALEALLASIPEPQPDPEPEPAAPPEPAPVAAPPVAPVAPPPPAPVAPPPPPPGLHTPDDVRGALPEWRAEMVKAAHILREAEPATAAPYRLLREAVWGDLHHLPDVGEDRQLPGTCAGDGFVERIEKLFGDDEFEEALEAIERALADAPLWLDLNLLACRALEELGRKYRRPKAAIEHEVRALVGRLPDVLGLGFSDGRPVASQETRIWIESELIPAGGAAAEGEFVDPVEKLAEEARALLTRKRVNEAVTLLVKNIDVAPNRRARFLLRLELARLCIDAGNPAMAVPQLDLLEKEVESFSLEEWEPDLCVSVVRLLWQCCSGKKKVDSLADRAPGIYERLCRLDPAAALTIKGP